MNIKNEIPATAVNNLLQLSKLRIRPSESHVQEAADIMSSQRPQRKVMRYLSSTRKDIDLWGLATALIKTYPKNRVARSVAMQILKYVNFRA